MSDETEAKQRWFARLKAGLSRTSSGISEGIAGIFTRRKLDAAMLEELEELLILADMGAGVAARLVAEFGKGRFDREISPREVKEALAAQIAVLLAPVAAPLEMDAKAKPYVVLVVGVNGNGKTTTMGKLAYRLSQKPLPPCGGVAELFTRAVVHSAERVEKSDAVGGDTAQENTPHDSSSALFHSLRPQADRSCNGLASSAPPQGGSYKVLLAAADTFRAAAVEQLKIWGERAGVSVVSAEEGADPAAVAYRAFEQARAEGADVLLIDTAGRLHNKKNLMEELQKISRVLKKLDTSAPHTVLLVLDGTTGQNAHVQVAAFQELIHVDALVVTKLDGTAKGGVVVALAEKFGLPIHAIGVGEGIDDLRPFSSEDFARSLMGL